MGAVVGMGIFVFSGLTSFFQNELRSGNEKLFSICD